MASAKEGYPKRGKTKKNGETGVSPNRKLPHFWLSLGLKVIKGSGSKKTKQTFGSRFFPRENGANGNKRGLVSKGRQPKTHFENALVVSI